MRITIIQEIAATLNRRGQGHTSLLKHGTDGNPQARVLCHNGAFARDTFGKQGITLQDLEAGKLRGLQPLPFAIDNPVLVRILMDYMFMHEALFNASQRLERLQVGAGFDLRHLANTVRHDLNAALHRVQKSQPLGGQP